MIQRIKIDKSNLTKCHSQPDCESRDVWIPAFAGMTLKGAGMTLKGAGMTLTGAGMTVRVAKTIKYREYQNILHSL
jgi:hypothetical protein